MFKVSEEECVTNRINPKFSFFIYGNISNDLGQFESYVVERRKNMKRRIRK
jgi:hypothetical protein